MNAISTFPLFYELFSFDSNENNKIFFWIYKFISDILFIFAND